MSTYHSETDYLESFEGFFTFDVDDLFFPESQKSRDGSRDTQDMVAGEESKRALTIHTSLIWIINLNLNRCKSQY